MTSKLLKANRRRDRYETDEDIELIGDSNNILEVYRSVLSLGQGNLSLLIVTEYLFHVGHWLVGHWLGIAIAGVGIFLSDRTATSIYDSISSLSIGCILIVFAFFLARENKGLLIGESISRKDYKMIVSLIRDTGS